MVIGHQGQDGTLLSLSLRQKGYQVLGIGRQCSNLNGDPYSNPRIQLNDNESIAEAFSAFKPDEIYYLAAYHSSSEGLETDQSIEEEYLCSHNTHVIGLLNILSTIVMTKSKAKLFYASSSLIFSGTENEVQNETTQICPQGIYGITKAEGMWLCREFRNRHNVFASVGILYNHESHLRKSKFLSAKIIQTVLRIASGSIEKLEVGNLSSRVDWSYASDFVEAFQCVLKLEHTEDFIIASGEANSIEHFLDIVFGHFSLNKNDHIIINPKLLHRQQPTKIGNIDKLKSYTDWRPTNNFPDMVTKLINDHINAKSTEVG